LQMPLPDKKRGRERGILIQTLPEERRKEKGVTELFSVILRPMVRMEGRGEVFPTKKRTLMSIDEKLRKKTKIRVSLNPSALEKKEVAGGAG